MSPTTPSPWTRLNNVVTVAHRRQEQALRRQRVVGGERWRQGGPEEREEDHRLEIIEEGGEPLVFARGEERRRRPATPPKAHSSRPDRLDVSLVPEGPASSRQRSRGRHQRRGTTPAPPREVLRGASHRTCQAGLEPSEVPRGAHCPVTVGRGASGPYDSSRVASPPPRTRIQQDSSLGSLAGAELTAPSGPIRYTLSSWVCGFLSLKSGVSLRSLSAEVRPWCLGELSSHHLALRAAGVRLSLLLAPAGAVVLPIAGGWTLSRRNSELRGVRGSDLEGRDKERRQRGLRP